MDVLYPRCCGLDIHKKLVVACVIAPGPTGEPTKTIRTFGTMTADLLKLSDWLTTSAVSHVAMESTSVYWKPVWNILEGAFELLLANPRHMKAVPGRKSDVKDCEWIADLLRHGLLRGSVVPDRDRRELRELTRYRTALIHERSAEVNRLQKVLEGANIKLAAVASDIMGKSGRAILTELMAGTTDAAMLANLALGRLREKIPQLEQALTGRVGPHQRYLIARQLAHIDFLDQTIGELDGEIVRRMLPVQALLEVLDEIPGVGPQTAQAIIAEVGSDLSRFPTARHLASWAGLIPGQDESAGKRRSSRIRPGGPWLRAILVEAAHAAGRVKDSYLAAQYHRLAARRGKKKAAIAVAHSILVIAYMLLTRHTTYCDLGSSYYDERDRQRLEHRLVERLQGLGYKVTLEPAKPAA